MVSYDGRREFLFVCFNDVGKYLEVTIMMSLVVVVGMVNIWRNQETFFQCELNCRHGSILYGNDNVQG